MTEMRRRFAICCAMTAVAFGVRADRYMFGPEDAAERQRVFAGFDYVTESNAMFSAGIRVPWRWEFEAQGMRSITWANPNAGSKPADVLLEHGIVCTGGTRLEIPADGPRRIHVWIGDWFRGWDRFFASRGGDARVHASARSGVVRLTCAGKVRYDRRLAPDTCFREWCKGEDSGFSRHDDLWDQIVKPIYDEIEFDAEAENGRIALELENVLLAAIAVERTAVEMKRTLADVEKARREEFYRRYPWKPQPDGALPEAAKNGGTLLLFRKGVSDSVFPWTRPSDEEVTDEISVYAAQGEQEPIRFGLLPLVDLPDLEVRIGDFNRGGRTLSVADNADFWQERYKGIGCDQQVGVIRDVRKLDPMSYVLQTPARQDGEALTPRMYVLDVRVPDRLEPGSWRASVDVLSRGVVVHHGSIRLRVLPFSLEKAKDVAAPYGFQMYYETWPLSAPGGGTERTWESWTTTAKFLDRHGFSNYYLSPAGCMKMFTITGELGRSKITQTPENAANMERLFKLMNPSGREKFFVYQFHTALVSMGWKGYIDPSSGRVFNHSTWDVKRNRDVTPQEWADWERQLTDIRTFVPYMNAKFKERGYPEVRWYFGGELDNWGEEAVREGARLAETIRSVGGVTHCVVNGPLSRKYLVKASDHFWANPGTPITEDLKAELAAGGHGFGTHNCGDSRFMSGLHFWRTGSEGRYQETVFYINFLWPYCLLPWNYNTSLVYPTQEGGLRPTLRFLAYREARDDYLYLLALDQALVAAYPGLPAVGEAKAFLENLRARIVLDPKYYRKGPNRAREGTQESNDHVFDDAAIERVRRQAAKYLSVLSSDCRGTVRGGRKED